MASATVTAQIGGQNMPLLVVYPRFQLTDAAFRGELQVVRNWFVAFNGNVAVSNATHHDAARGRLTFPTRRTGRQWQKAQFHAGVSRSRHSHDVRTHLCR